MIKVLICGISGRMGTATANAVNAVDDLELVGGVSSNPESSLYDLEDGSSVPLYGDLQEAITETEPDVMVDFTRPTTVAYNVRVALDLGINCVVGTTGLSQDTLADLAGHANNDAALFFAPNFTTGAVLMMKFAEMAAKHFPDAEVIEFHHNGKADSPSGTAVRTAHMIAAARIQPSHAPGKETELAGMEGARGALIEGVPVHSIRSDGYVAHQEVILGSSGQTLTIRHDSINRLSYMPGVLLACRKVPAMTGLTIGLENLLED